MDQLVGVSAASQITGLLPQTLRARAESGRLTIAARNPLRFKLSFILRYRETAPALKIGRPRDIVIAAARLSDKYARAASTATVGAKAVAGASPARRRSGASLRKRVPTCR